MARGPRGPIAAPFMGNIGATNITTTGTVASGAQTITVNAVGTAQTPGETIKNTTAAAAGAQQYSPMQVLTGQGWKTNATAASQQVDYALQVVPVQGAAAPTADLVFFDRINAGTWTEIFRIRDTTTTPGGVVSLKMGGNTVCTAGSAQSTVTFGDSSTAQVKTYVAANEIDFLTGGAARAYILNAGFQSNTALIDYAYTVTSPVLHQETDSTAGVTGDTFTLQAQSVSGTGAAVGGQLTLAAGDGTANNASGGHVLLRGGSKTGTGTVGNLSLHALAANWQAMEGGVFCGNVTTAPTGNPASGGFLYVVAGALTWRGSSGTITTIAAA